MNIININSYYNLNPWHISFTQTVIRKYRSYTKYQNPLIEISENIPIYLVSEYTFSLVKKGIYNVVHRLEDEDSFKDFEEENEGFEYQKTNFPETEKFGYFVSHGAHGIPEIYLCMEIILKYPNNEYETTYLIAKVLIHLFAHAYMDTWDYGKEDEFFYWMDEACANELTLNFFSDYQFYIDEYEKSLKKYQNAPSPYEFVKDLILSQPNNYKLGYYFHEYGYEFYNLWRLFYDNKRGKKKDIEDWLDYIKNVVMDQRIRDYGLDYKYFKEFTNKVLMSRRDFKKFKREVDKIKRK